MEQKNTSINSSKKAKSPLFDRRSKAGSYTVAVSAVLLAVLIVVNLLISALPSKYTVLDTSTSGKFTISETTEKFLHKLSENVTLYMICENGETDAELLTLTERYVGFSSKINIRVIDPVKDPTFVSKYTESTLSNHSFIVESEKRYKVIDNASLYYYYAEGYGRIDPTDSYTLLMLQYNGYSPSLYFDAENVLTSAIEYVTTESIPKAYILSGHGEAALSATLLSAMGSYNIEYETLDIVNDSASIPDNASCVIIVDPLNDISKNEADKLLEYLKDGGHLFVSTNYNDTDKTNLLSVLEYYGASALQGMVYEGNSSNHTANTPYKIYPKVNGTHAITADIISNNYKALIPSAHAIALSSVRNVKSEILFSTSDSSYLKVDDSESSEKASYNLGVALSETVDSGTSKIVWFSSSEMLTDTVASAVSYGNYYYYLYSLNWMFDSFESELAHISGTSLDEPTLTVSEGAARLWSVMFIAVIPLAIFVPGLCLWIRRRRR